MSLQRNRDQRRGNLKDRSSTPHGFSVSAQKDHGVTAVHLHSILASREILQGMTLYLPFIDTGQEEKIIVVEPRPYLHNASDIIAMLASTTVKPHHGVHITTNNRIEVFRLV